MHLGGYQQVHHRLGMNKYGLLHTEAGFWRMASQSSRSPGSRAPFGGRGGLTQCFWTEYRSCHPQRQPLTSMWRQSVAGQTVKCPSTTVEVGCRAC